MLQNFASLGEYDLFLVQEHKLYKAAILFVNWRIGTRKAFWCLDRKMSRAEDWRCLWRNVMLTR